MPLSARQAAVAPRPPAPSPAPPTGLGLPFAHAAFRLPNLKAKLATAKQEFTAVWRGYHTEVADYSHTL
jgi:hypothetical protein